MILPRALDFAMRQLSIGLCSLRTMLRATFDECQMREAFKLQASRRASSVERRQNATMTRIRNGKRDVFPKKYDAESLVTDDTYFFRS